ncbi:VirB3 family type IV secretion system protein [Brucella pseudogrignonensis]
MLQSDEIYRGLLRKPSVMFLPLLEFVCFLSVSGLLFMWVQSLFILIPIAFLYVALLVASKWDQNFLHVIWITSKNLKRHKNVQIWGGASYEP